MAERGGQIGNKNAAKENRIWSETLHRSIVQDEAKRVRLACEALQDKAAAGDLKAIEMLADRLDGKPHQSIDADLRGTFSVLATPLDEKL